jgi:DNA-binding MarR family transcriptional regulator
MDTLIRKFERYLYEILGVAVVANPWSGSNKLPIYLKDAYRWYQVTLLGTPCLVMESSDGAWLTPAIIRKNLIQVQEKSGLQVLYLCPVVSAYNRKRLIEQKVPFVVPGNQMYLPELGIDLREHFKKLRDIPQQLSPSTQAVVLYALHHGTNQPYTPSQLAKELDYAPMTMTRALDELEAAGIGKVTAVGRERVLRFEVTAKELWEKAKIQMRSPMNKRAWISAVPPGWRGVLAGLSALSHYTMLAEPALPVYAVSAEYWKQVQQRSDVTFLPSAETGAIEVEIWSYSPHLLVVNQQVDRFSLYLSLQNATDERVESALRELMEEVPW